MPLQHKEIAESQLTFTNISNDHLLITISGALTVSTISTLWDQTFKLQQQIPAKTLTFEAKYLTVYDSIGAILILELKKRQLATGRKFALQNCNEGLQDLLTFLEKQKDESAAPISPPTNFITRLGKAISTSNKALQENITFFGMLMVYLVQFFIHRQRIRWSDFWRALAEVGPGALPIVLLIGFLVGIIITFQSAEPFNRFGAQIYIIDLVSLGLVRELGPLMTAILISGRTASAFAAEIGSMKINQEINALTTMGLEPIQFLTIPRILAAIIMTPLLSMFLIMAGLLGCFLIMLSLGYNLSIFKNEIYSIISLSDFFAGLAKTFVFGSVIASIGCMHGIKTSMGASAVGNSTTMAVVGSLIMLVILDGIFALIYYIMGI